VDGPIGQEESHEVDQAGEDEPKEASRSIHMDLVVGREDYWIKECFENWDGEDRDKEGEGATSGMC
jgi:hypothetical protein